jgi:hypothetical protein
MHVRQIHKRRLRDAEIVMSAELTDLVELMTLVVEGMRDHAPMAPPVPATHSPRRRRWRIMIVLLSIAVLAACSEASPLYGPNSPRDGAGRPVDPIYGTPVPGYPLYGF